jgi:hypothetical protein
MVDFEARCRTGWIIRATKQADVRMHPIKTRRDLMIRKAIFAVATVAAIGAAALIPTEASAGGGKGGGGGMGSGYHGQGQGQGHGHWCGAFGCRY